MAPQKPKGSLNVPSQDLERSSNSRLPCRGKSIGIGSANQDCTRSQTDCFDDVTPAPDPPVHQDFGLTIYGGNNFRQCPQRWRYRIQLPTAVVRDNDCRCTFIHGPPGVVSR
jgi:hypothetical protein